MELSKQILSDITVYMKYAKFLPEKQRRETWEARDTHHAEKTQNTKTHRTERTQAAHYPVLSLS